MTPTTIPLYQRIALAYDLPEHNLCKGDVAVVVEHLPGTAATGGEDGYALEVFNALGETIAVVNMIAVSKRERLGKVFKTDDRGGTAPFSQWLLPYGSFHFFRGATFLQRSCSPFQDKRPDRIQSHLFPFFLFLYVPQQYLQTGSLLHEE